MKDFKKVLTKSSELINDLLQNHEDAIKRSFSSSDEESFKIGLSLKLTPVGSDIGVEAGISFIEIKIKDSVKITVSDQIPLEFAGQPR